MNPSAPLPHRPRTPQFKTSILACGLTLLFSAMGMGLYALCVDRQTNFEDKLVELESLKADRRRLVSHNTRMHDRVEYLKTDAGVEEIAREKLGLVRPGELAYAVVPPPPESFTEADEKDSPHLNDRMNSVEPQEDFGVIVRVLRHLFGPEHKPQQVSS